MTSSSPWRRTTTTISWSPLIATPPRRRAGTSRRPRATRTIGRARRPSATRRSRSAIACSIAAAKAAGSSGSARSGSISARLVERLVRRRRPRERRTPSPRSPECRSPRSATGTRRRPRRDRGERARRPRRSPSRRMPGASRSGCSPQPSAPTTASCSSRSQQPVRLDEHVQILPRLEGRDREDVRRAEIGGRPVRAEDVLRRGMRDADPLARHAERRRDVPSGVRRVDEDDVARRGRVPVLATCIDLVLRGRPLGMVKRHEVVDRRRAHARALRRVHPVREVEDVEARRAVAPPPGGRARSMPCARRGRRAAATCAPRRRPRRAQRGSGAGPVMLVGANATISCSPAAASASPPSEPRM